MNNKADFVIENKEVKQPDIVSDDSLALYYDTKGKTNTDYHKSTLLDMSGNGKHGKLHNFAYEKLSGYTDEGGLVFDGVDDTLERADVEGVQIVSATKNLFDGSKFEEYLQSGDITWDGRSLTYKRTSGNSYSGAMYEFNLTVGRDYFLSYEMTGGSGHPAIRILDEDKSTYHSFNSNTGGKFTASTDKVYIVFSYAAAADGGRTLSNIQLEEGSTATSYVPYIPTAKMTYQLSNNVISYREDGTIRWVKDGKVMERKGINILSDTNNKGHDLTYKPTRQHHQLKSWQLNPNQGERFYVRALVYTMDRYTQVYFSDNIVYTHTKNTEDYEGWQIIERVFNANTSNNVALGVRSTATSNWSEITLRNIQLINLTATFGAGNEPTLEEIQAEPDKWQWLPNPMDLLESKELKGNILGDMEDVVDDHARDEQSGLEVFTDKSDDSAVHVEVDGKSVQGTDKNLFDYTEITNYSFDTTWTTAYRIDKELKPNTSYTLSTNTPNYHTTQSTIYFNGSGFNSTVREGKPVTVRTPSTGKVHILIFSGRQYADDILKGSYYIQLEEGSTATDFEPHKPTPNQPIEIHSLNDFDVVSSVGKRNILLNSQEPGPLTLYSNNNLTAPVEGGVEKGIDWISGKQASDDSFYISTYVSQTYKNYVGQVFAEDLHDYEGYITCSVEVMSEHPLEAGMFLSPKTTKLESNKWTRIHYTSKNQVRPFGLFVESNPEVPLGTKLYWRNYKIEKSTTATPYTPAPEDITEDNNHPLIDKIKLLLSEPLRSVGDVKDRLFRDSDGLWKIERNVSEFVINGTESNYWSTGTSSTDSDYVFFYKRQSSYGMIRPYNSSSPVSMSHFEDLGAGGYGSLTQEGFRRWTDNTPFIFSMKSSRLNSLDSAGIDAWFRSNPTTVLYEMRESLVEVLDQEIQDKLNNLRSFQDSNYVYTVINDKTDNLSPVVQENLKPTLHSTFQAKDYLKENRTVNSLLMWDRPLSDDELLHQNRLFHRRFNFRSDTIKGEPVVWNVNLLNGGVYAHSLEQNYTISI